MLLTLLYVVYAFVGIGIIIFIHELGHFLAAKKVGVRVERFCIGFDPPFRGRNLRFFSFRRGETEYALGAIPFGGYVKMAGETATDPDKTGAGDELMSKSVGARALVFVAGAAMNIVSAFIFFIIAFSIGVQFTKPEAGVVLTSYPAWEAGLRAGDRILAINGRPVMEFMELMVSVALAGRTEPLRLTVERTGPDGAMQTLPIEVSPRWNDSSGFHEIGVAPGISNVIGELNGESAAARAGLEEGDRIVGLVVDGVDFPAADTASLLDALEGLVSFRAGKTLELRVLRGTDEKRIPFTLREEPTRKQAALIGIVSGQGTFVRALRKDAEAGRVLRPGDRLVSMNGLQLKAFHWLTFFDIYEEAKRSGDGSLRLEIAGSDGATRVATVPGDAFIRWTMGGDIYWDGPFGVVASIASDSPLAAAGLKVGDALYELAGETCFFPADIEKILAKRKGAPLDGAQDLVLRILRDGEKVDLKVSPAALREESGVVWRTIPPLGAAMRGGPADRAGIAAGCSILEIGAQPVNSWKELMDAVGGVKPGNAVEVVWKTPAGEVTRADVTVGLTAPEPLPAFQALQSVVRAGIGESVVLGARRTVVVSKWVFLTLRSLFRREVSAKNLQGPIGIAHVLTKVSEQGLGTLIYFLAIISINLGLFNLLPFPILDGGHLFFLLVEKVKGSPVDVRVQEWATNIAFLLIISLAVFVTFNDLSRLFH
jgi:RIP metalloprotease RseP